MHEMHLMQQVVKAVEQALHESEGGTPSIVRLKVSALSHLADHDLGTLQSAFQLASRGTKAEGALLEVVPVPVPACCRSCGLMSHIDRVGVGCEDCGSTDVDLQEIPEVVVQELVVTE